MDTILWLNNQSMANLHRNLLAGLMRSFVYVSIYGLFHGKTSANNEQSKIVTFVEWNQFKKKL